MSDIGKPGGEQTVDRKALLLEQFSEAETAPATPAAQPAKTDGVVRDEAGRFAPKNADGSEKTLVQTTQQAAAPVTEEPAWKRPPTSWKKEYHEIWGTLPDQAKEYAFQREEQMRAGVEPLIPKAKQADAFNQALEPYMPTIRGLGIEPAAAVGALAKADHDLRTLPPQQKLAYAANLLAGYGIDVRAFSGDQQFQAPPVADQNYYNLQQALLQMRGELQAMTQAQQAVEDQRAMTEIQRFAVGKDHFDAVRPTMVQLLKSEMASDLEDAYEKAIRLTPEVFDAIQAAKQGAERSAKITSADKAAKAAKAAAVSVRSSTPGASAPTKAQDRRSMLAEAFDSVSDRL